MFGTLLRNYPLNINLISFGTVALYWAFCLYKSHLHMYALASNLVPYSETIWIGANFIGFFKDSDL